MSVFGAFGQALRDLLQPRVLAVLLLPMLGSIVIWSVLAWIFWAPWTEGFQALIDATSAGRWLISHVGSWVLGSMSALFVIALLMPAVLVTAILITELVAMPVIVSVVARIYPGLERRGEGTVLGSVTNAIVAVTVFALLWIVTLPLWLTGIGAVVLPALNSAYLNQRLFRYDALAEHATPRGISGARQPGPGPAVRARCAARAVVLRADPQPGCAGGIGACFHALLSGRARERLRRRGCGARVRR